MSASLRWTFFRSNGRWRRAGRYAAIASATLLVLMVLAYIGARIYWPMVATQKLNLEEQLTQMTRHNVRLGRVEPYWDGLNPGVRIWGAVVDGDDGHTPAVRVAEVQGSVAILPLFWGRVEPDRLVFVRPTATLTRHADGRVAVVGMTLNQAASSDGGFAWLLAQPRLAIEEGEFQWTDARDPQAPPLVLNGVDIRVRNSGDRHRLSAGAALPPSMCRECSLSMDVHGNPVGGSWEGKISVRTRGLDVAALPLIVRERLPSELRGEFDLQLRSEWRDGRPRIVRGEAAVKGLRLPLGENRRPLTPRALSADVDWRTADGNWRLELSGALLALARSPWSVGRFSLARNEGVMSVEAEHVYLDDVTDFLAGYRGEYAPLEHWAQAHPVGQLENLEATWRGDINALESFDVKARVDKVSVEARERIPGARNLSGRVSLNQDGGEFDLDAERFALNLPTVFRDPLETRRANGRVRWDKTDTGWRIQGSDLNVRARDGNGTGEFTYELPRDPASSPVLKLRVDFRDGDGSHAARYYPAYRLPPRTLAWMESAFVAGRIVSGHLLYEGPTRRWPFDDGQGRFEIRAHVKDGVYRYLQGWTPLTQADAHVQIDGSTVNVTGTGRIGALVARDIVVNVARTEGETGREARMEGRLDGPVAETIRLLQTIDSPKVAGWQSFVRTIDTAQGTGVLNLDVRVPIKQGIAPSYVANYRFADAALLLESGTGLRAANGTVRFGENGLREGNLHGQLFGGPVEVLATRGGDNLHVQAAGKVLPAEVLRSRRPIAERLSGTVDWSMNWRGGAAGAQFGFDADFSAVRSRLPAPLGKSDAGGLGKVSITTEQSRADAIVLALNGGSLLSGKASFAREDGSWRFQKARIDVGGAGATRLPTRDGIETAVNVEALDVDLWLPLLGDGAKPASAPEIVATTVILDTKRLTLANRNWGRLFLYLARRGGEWRTVLDGDAVAGEGTLRFPAKSVPHARFDLAYLRLPESGSGDIRDKAPADPHNLPALDLHALSFEYKNRKFGELDFAALPVEQGWRIQRMNLTRPEMKLAAQGIWRAQGARQSSEVHVELDSDDMGATLDAFGATGQMASGKVKIRTDLSWPSSPLRPTLAGLDGKVEVSAEKGRFLKFDPGAARLFGLLDLRSIGRYLTFDFSPAFGQGFVFDAIHGTTSIERGNAYTSDLIIKGPSLGLGVSGRVGLAAEDYDLTIDASPKFGSTLTLTSLGLFGPAAAAAVLALQRLFKRQIEEGTRVTYFIKGPWDHPTVTKQEKRPPAEANSPPTVLP